MKTIEERAKEKYPQHDRIAQRLIESYVNIANEQKQIDIDKACEWLKYNYLRIYNEEYLNITLPTDWRTAFKNAMEE